MSGRLTSTLQILTDANELLAAHAALILRVRSGQQIHRMELKELDSPPQELLKLPLIHTSPTTPSPEPAEEEEEEVLPDPAVQQQHQNVFRQDLAPTKRARAARYVNYVPEEETIRNDYSQIYVDSGEWPQNWVLGAEPDHRFEE
jgi:mRNA (2'-O-methyladenosine-N6-)-methyltransferase